MKKGFAPILIVLSIIFVLLFVYLLSRSGIESLWQPKISTNDGGEISTKDLTRFQKELSSPTPTTDETANWKTYTNTTFKFTLAYPPDWNTGKTDNKYWDTISTSDYTLDEKVFYDEIAKKGAKILIPTNKNDTKETFTKIQEGSYTEGSDTKPKKKLVDFKNIVIAGMPALIYDYLDSNTLEGTIVEIKIQDNVVLSINMLHSEGEYREKLIEILSTLKLTE